ncbi:hypothetical protein GCM10023188_20100 [Pontibacter saemangeumensis]|uniref:DUF4136 domain-containing protein n=1 Tax=Pontibacter saemangeumensis TaxID=1084525 RepID=A0ABP8LM87_9BACT
MRRNFHFPTRAFLSFLSMLLVGAGLYGCAPSTRITGTWKNPEVGNRDYDRIVVAAITDNIRARQTVETDMQTQLQQRGITAIRSMDLLPPTVSEDGPDVNKLLQKIKDQDYGAILTVALLDEETETRYVPGNYGYAPVTRFGWYGRFRGYYTYWLPTLYEPGYYTEEKIYFLETNLYDVHTENLLWSAQSKSYSPASLRKASETLAELTASRMAQENLIK